eukprot:1138531-Pelagomonas_calceolata.AAC.13
MLGCACSQSGAAPWAVPLSWSEAWYYIILRAWFFGENYISSAGDMERNLQPVRVVSGALAGAPCIFRRSGLS